MIKDISDLEYEVYMNYIDFYNKNNNKVEALSHLICILDRCESRMEKLSEKIDKMTADYPVSLKFACTRDSVNIGALFLDHQMSLLIKKINLKLHQRSILPELEMVYEIATNKVKSYLDEARPEGGHGVFLNQLRQIFVVGKKHLVAKVHVKILRRIEKKVLERNYKVNFSDTDLWGGWHPKVVDNKKSFSNEFDKQISERSQELTEYYLEDVREEALNLIEKEKGRCFTPRGNASSFLYKNIHNKLSDLKQEDGFIEKPSEGWVADRINELINEYY